MPTPPSDMAQNDLTAVLAKIDEWPEPYVTIGRRLHETIISAGPKLKTRLWYGMPSYATARSAPVFVFFRLDDGVMSMGLSEKATVDRESDSTLRPCAWFIDEIDDRTLAKVAELARTAFS